MEYFGHHLQISIAAALDLINTGTNMAETPDGVPYMLEELDASRTSILTEEEDDSYKVWRHLKSTLEKQRARDLWEELKETVTSASNAELRIKLSEGSWVTTSKDTLEILRPHAMMRVKLTEKEAVQIASNIISHIKQ